MMVPEIEILRRVWDEGHYLVVGPSEDFPGQVRMWTDNPVQAEWFGNISIDGPHEFMVQLGRALIACAEEMEIKGE